MAAIFARHPRYVLGAGFLILCTFLLLAERQSSPFKPRYPAFPQSAGDTQSLSVRLSAAEETYQRVLKNRKGLIHKFGPTPDKIEMFPADVRPWPPYTVWDFFPAAFNCPHEVERIGALGDGGKWVCGLSRVATKPDCVVYSVGINHESSFEAEVLERTTGCQIWGYDFSVSQFGPEIPASLSYRTHFFPYGLSGSDRHGPDDEQKMYTLQTLMKMNGHTFIDILKIDIEAWEFDTLTSLIQAYHSQNLPLPFGQLQLEIHAWHKSFPEYLQFWEGLEKMGLRPFWTEPNLVYQNYNRGEAAALAEYSFINIMGNHDLLSSA
ncbi:hypothetical protein SISNIDRAFT_448803 [Sistotremastrum niveocremeum HHB9708]|uniref:Methyltransferase domain-containing protein n=2 Tax=Sistotremastraceae TaxID=3402574 RepID=A0A165A6E4_9AGAM|nr:hypothetical protein SISNIDRAFT_448803 [Sistotremastrum niveocremeum HHB9708]KZT43533.1 hypothetical protein SISSUDRAFT_1039961 [Sistotremastrum suecicum HHB10207 ss-3]